MRDGIVRFAQILGILLYSQLVTAADEPPQYPIQRIDSTVVIDGVLDDAAWQRLEPITDFHQVQPEDHGIPSKDTEVWVAYDSEFFYLAARLHYSDPSLIRAKQLIQGRTFFSDDRFELTLDTFHDHRNAFLFQLNPNGIRREALAGNDYFIEDWDGVWDGASRVDELGWSLEMAIPFKTLSFDPENETWGMNLWRFVAHNNEEMAWSSQERSTIPAFKGDITGMSGMEQGIGLDLKPSIIVRQTKNNVTNKTEFEIEPAFDAFYKLSTGITGALTINTDFSATEVDDRQVNLTRFSLFFPEKRDFFLQDAAIFEFADIDGNGRPFFSRQIGLSAAGQPLDINGGLKVTGRTGAWNIGVLAVNQDASGMEPDANLLVGRASYNLLQESSFGVIVTDGSPDGTDNTVTGTDFNYRRSDVFGDKTALARVWYLQSDSPGLGGDDHNYGFEVAYPNDRFDSTLAINDIGGNYNPALGFANRLGIRNHVGSFRYRSRPKTGFWRAINHAISWQQIDGANGDIETRVVTLVPFDLFSNDSDSFELELIDNREVITQAFDLVNGIIIQPGSYDFMRQRFRIDTGIRRPVSGTFIIEEGDFFDGKNQEITVGFEWRPSAHFFLGAEHTRNDIRLTGGNFITRIYQLRADIAFNARWSLLNFVQFDNVSNQMGLNTRLRYIPKAGRELFVVFNHGQIRDNNGNFRSEFSELVAKLGITFRF